MLFASTSVRNKHIRTLVKNLEKEGLRVTITAGKQHIRVENPKTNKIVFFGANSTGDWRAVKNILRDLKQVGYDHNNSS